MRKLLAFYLFFNITFLLHSQEVRHVVKPGETVYSLARLYGLSVEELMAINKIQDPGRVRSGSVLNVTPAATVPVITGETLHTVRPGETLYSLARRYGMTPDELMRRNSLTDARRLRVGSQIQVGSRPSTETSSTYDFLHPEVVKVLPLPDLPTIVTRPLVGLLFRTPGGEFKAVTGGTVVHRDHFRAVGNLLLISAENGLVFGYAGWSSVSVELGETVKSGDILGKLANDPPGSLLYFVYYQEKIIPVNQYFTKKS